MKKIFYSILIASAALLFASCEHSIKTEEGIGYLDLSLNSESELIVSTKASVTLTEEEKRALNVTIEGREGTEYSTTSTWGEISGSSVISLKSGRYTITVSSPADNQTSGAFFQGSADFIIEIGQTTPVNVECTIINSQVIITCKPNFLSEISRGFTISILNASDVVEHSWTNEQITSENPTVSGFIPAGNHKLYIRGKRWSNTDNSVQEVNQYINFTISAAESRTLNLDAASTGNMDFTLTVNGNFTSEITEDIQVPGYDDIQ